MLYSTNEVVTSLYHETLKYGTKFFQETLLQSRGIFLRMHETKNIKKVSKKGTTIFLGCRDRTFFNVTSSKLEMK